LLSPQAYSRTAEEALNGLYKLALSILRRHADAQDAVQQALLKTWEKRASIREETFKAYLTRVVINECRNIQRHSMRETPQELSELSVHEASAEYRELYDAIDLLPEHYKLPIMLKYLNGLSEKEAAKALNIPVPAFKSRLYRARKALRAHLDREVVFE
jgi:RNA polymerase sigma-70 factor (ECF subfamily)